MLKPGLELRQIQTLRLSPQQLQMISLLLLTRQELQQKIEQELEQNPVLEIAGKVEDSESEPYEFSDMPSNKSEVPEEYNDEKLMETLTSTEDKEHDKNVDIDWSEYFEHDFRASHTSSSTISLESDISTFESYTAKPVSLKEFLIEQLRESVKTDMEFKIGEFLIYNLDEKGYLNYKSDFKDSDLSDEEMLEKYLESVASHFGVKVEEVENVWEKLKSFDPPGIAARDMKEALLIQYDRQQHENCVVIDIIEEYLPEVAQNKLPQIAKSLGVEVSEVIEAVKIIKSLNPYPAFAFRDTNPEDIYVKPDVFVEYLAGEYFVQVNEIGIPRLAISNFYKNMIKNKKNISQKEYKYIKSKLDSAKWLIKSIDQRKKTLYEVTKVIVELQKDFLENGIKHLKPLTRKEVAERLGIHEATVSRAIAGKYVQTPRGLFPLSFFFTSSLQSRSGEAASSARVKQLIKELIDQEDKRKPLSDQKITEKLNERGIQIKRRTVQKYREEMRIPSSSKRKVFK